MFVLATCEPEVDSGLLTFLFFVAAAYLLWFWAALLRGPGESRGRSFITYGVGLLVGVPLLWPALDGPALWLVLVGPGLAAVLAAAIAGVGRWPRPGRPIAAAALGSLTPATLLTLALLFPIGTGSFCLD